MGVLTCTACNKLWSCVKINGVCVCVCMNVPDTCSVCDQLYYIHNDTRVIVKRWIIHTVAFLRLSMLTCCTLKSLGTRLIIYTIILLIHSGGYQIYHWSWNDVSSGSSSCVCVDIVALAVECIKFSVMLSSNSIHRSPCSFSLAHPSLCLTDAIFDILTPLLWSIIFF